MLTLCLGNAFNAVHRRRVPTDLPRLVSMKAGREESDIWGKQFFSLSSGTRFKSFDISKKENKRSKPIGLGY